MAAYFLLGPQRPIANIDLAFNALGDSGPAAVVSAGWQDAEGDIAEVQEAVARQLIDLHLYQRAEDVLASEVGLRELYRERQKRLQFLQRLYRLRLRQSMLAARRLLRAVGDPVVVRHEQRHAIAQQRSLDRHHLQRINAIHKEFDIRVANERLPKLSEHAKEIAHVLAGCQTVVITGGNVAVLLNRLRLFDVGSMLKTKHLVSWSAGAMVLTDRVVLFHDNTPQGRRDAEVFDQGLGIINEIVLLPDAKHRLDVSDKIQVALFCRRFAPVNCFTLNSGSLLRFDDGCITDAEDVRRLSRNGALRKVRTR